MTDDAVTGSTLRQAAISSAAWVAVEKWGTRLTQLLVFTLLARLLVPEEFGLLALATVVVMLTNLLVDQGFSKALIQREDLAPEHCDAAFWTSLGLGSVLAGVIALLAGPISEVLGEPQVAPVLRWLVLGVPISALSATPAALMQRDFQFRGLAVRRLIGGVAGGMAGVACALAGAGVWSLVAQTLVAAAAGVAVLWRTSTWRPRLRFSASHAKDLWVFGIAVVGIDLMGLVNQQADRLIVGAVLGPVALGYYYIGFRLLSLAVDSLTAVVATVSLTTFSRLQNDVARLRNVFYTCTRISSVLCIPAFAGLAVLAPIVIPLLFGPQWGRSVEIMQVLAALGIINSVAYFDRSVLLALGRERWALGLSAGQAVLNVVIAAIMAPHGILAVAIGVTIRQYLFWPVRIWILRKAMDLDVVTYLKQWTTPLGASALMVAAMLGLQQVLGGLPDVVELAASVIVGAIVYMVGMRLVAPRSFAELVGLVPARLRPAGRVL